MSIAINEDGDVYVCEFAASLVSFGFIQVTATQSYQLRSDSFRSLQHTF